MSNDINNFMNQYDYVDGWDIKTRDKLNAFTNGYKVSEWDSKIIKSLNKYKQDQIIAETVERLQIEKNESEVKDIWNNAMDEFYSYEDGEIEDMEV